MIWTALCVEGNFADLVILIGIDVGIDEACKGQARNRARVVSVALNKSIASFERVIWIANNKQPKTWIQWVRASESFA